MGKKLDFLLGKMAAPSRSHLPKLKTLLALTISRLAVARNHRQLRRDVAHSEVARLLQLGHVDGALLSVEQEMKEQDTVDAFSMIENYCHLLADRYMLLDHKECPEELLEAVSGLVFAAPRCAGELPELDDVRRIFSSKYGKGFVSAIVELRSDSPVNAKMIQKLSMEKPTLEMKQRMAKEIAQSKGISLEFCEIPSKISEEPFGKNPSPGTHQQYIDAATAAQAAFESAAFAARAARAAVELCRSESQEKATGKIEGDNESSSRANMIKARKPNGCSISINKPGKNDKSSVVKKKINREQNSGSDSEEKDETEAEKIDSPKKEPMRRSPSSAGSSSSDEGEYNVTMLRKQHSPGGFKGKRVLFDKRENETGRGTSLGSKLPFEGTQQSSSPDSGENGTGSSGKVELRKQTEANNEKKGMSMLHLSQGKKPKPISVRTRR